MTPAPLSPAELIEKHQGLVRSLAVQVHRRFHLQVDLEDLVAYGQVGLAEAARQFDPKRGAQFSTYAYYRVRGALHDGASKMLWAARGSRSKLQFERMGGEVLREHHDLSAGDERPQTVESDAAWLVQITRDLTIVRLASSVSNALSNEPDGDESAAPAAALLRRELYERLHALIDALPEIERRLIQSTYFEGHTLQDAADELHISKSWASRLHAKSLQHLAVALRHVGMAD
jgi:RNA polymerase sigma factor for flagellar operon FliA